MILLVSFVGLVAILALVAAMGAQSQLRGVLERNESLSRACGTAIKALEEGRENHDTSAEILRSAVTSMNEVKTKIKINEAQAGLDILMDFAKELKGESA